MIFRNLLAAFVISTVCGCGLFPESITVPGPESTSLLPTVRGYIVMEQPCGGMVAVELPTLREITVRSQGSCDSGDMATIHMLSGPDDHGRIAYIEDHFFVKNEKNRRHLLKTIRVDGTEDTALFTRPGDAMWACSPIGHGEIGHTMSLAPTGGRVAFLTGIKVLQMPSGLLPQGSIEIWNIDEKTGKKTDIQALDSGLSWFPDGKHLAYVKMIDRKNNANLIDPADPIADSFIQLNWEYVPAVYIRDVESQTEAFLHIGWYPKVSIEGSKVLIGSYYVVPGTGKLFLLTGPGKDGAIAMLDDRTLLASCYPTTGAKVKFTGAWLVDGPAEMWAIKLTRTDSRAFQTVIPYFQSGMDISFGRGGRTPPN